MRIEHPVIALERAALDRWCCGDPSGFLEISASDVVYFDPFVPRRIDGIEALSALYEPLRGQIFAPSHEIIDPLVQEIGDCAVLTFRFVSCGGNEGAEMRWNCSEVYRKQDEGYRIVQTHWSFTAPGE